MVHSKLKLICFDVVSMKNVYSDIQKDDLIYINSIDVNPKSLNVYTTFPCVNHQKPKFNPGDKVKIINDFLAFIRGENVHLKGFEGVVYSSLNLVSGMYNQNVLNCSYDVDINGFIVVCQESDLELIEQPKKIEYRKDLYDLSDDIDGVLLPDSKPNIDFIQRFDKQ